MIYFLIILGTVIATITILGFIGNRIHDERPSELSETLLESAKAARQMYDLDLSTFTAMAEAAQRHFAEVSAIPASKKPSGANAPHRGTP